MLTFSTVVQKVGEVLTSRNALVLVFAAIYFAAVGPSIAQEFGPYRYRAGVEQNHFRLENNISVQGNKIVMRTCATMIPNYVEGQRQCWDGEPIDAVRRHQTLRWRDGHETYELDLETSRLTVSDGSPLADVTPGATPWPETQIVY